MIVFPNIKINLGLHVINKRPDGYHNIETAFYPLHSPSDVLEITPAATFAFKQTGLSIDSASDHNLCVRACRTLAEHCKIPPVEIHLHKTIPAGAGLGGGSSDAAFTLRALNRMFHLNLDHAVLKTIAATLGSDCPFFIDNQPSIATGRGERLRPATIDLSAWAILLVKPNIHVSTAEAYASITPQRPAEQLHHILSAPITTWPGRLINDFEAPVFRRHPEIASIKAQLYAAGAVYASMSGSGSTLFGIFPPDTNLSQLKDNFLSTGYWVFLVQGIGY